MELIKEIIALLVPILLEIIRIIWGSPKQAVRNVKSKREAVSQRL